MAIADDASGPRGGAGGRIRVRHRGDGGAARRRPGHPRTGARPGAERRRRSGDVRAVRVGFERTVSHLERVHRARCGASCEDRVAVPDRAAVSDDAEGTGDGRSDGRHSQPRKIVGREVSGVASWVDAPGDERWLHPDRGEVLRAMDRFHAVPDVNTRPSSWAEWLYFNGRTRDGRLRVYLTFLVGPRGDRRGSGAPASGCSSNATAGPRTTRRRRRSTRRWCSPRRRIWISPETACGSTA